ncbi:MAG: thiol reductant ABC exporter subunit CydD [Sulfitobacter sp.]
MTQPAPQNVQMSDPKAASDWRALGQKEQSRAAGLSVIANLIWPLQAALVAYALGGLVAGKDVPAMFVALSFVVLGGLRAIIGFASEAQAEKAAQKIVQAARAKIVAGEAARAQNNPFGGAGSIAALAGEKLDLVTPYVTRYTPARARVMVVPILFLLLALTQSWAVAVIFVISGPLIPVFMALVGMAAKEASQKQMAEIGNLNDLLVERLSALVDIRLLGAGDAVVAGFSAQAGDLRARTMAVLRVAFLSSTVLELFSAIGVAMVAVYVGFSLLDLLNFGAWGGGLTPEAGIFLLLLAPEFYQPLRDLSAAWHDKASADAVWDDLRRWEQDETPVLLGKGGTAPPLQGAASIALLGCRLPNGASLPDMTITQGESVALVGASGAGKTSILRMIAGLQSPLSGEVLVAGQKLDGAVADRWRARLGWMPQAPHFLNASLRRNISSGRAGDVDAALRQASIAQVVSGLPQGLNTRLGEAGGGLSGGEARRLTLARAVYANPDVILADEPTADLDAGTAMAVTEGLLMQAAQGATLVVATHDLALAQKMDRIIRIGAAP